MLDESIEFLGIKMVPYESFLLLKFLERPAPKGEYLNGEYDAKSAFRARLQAQRKEYRERISQLKDLNVRAEHLAALDGYPKKS